MLARYNSKAPLEIYREHRFWKWPLSIIILQLINGIKKNNTNLEEDIQIFQLFHGEAEVSRNGSHLNISKQQGVIYNILLNLQHKLLFLPTIQTLDLQYYYI